MKRNAPPMLVPNGIPQEFIRVKDVAKVSDRRKEMDILSRTNGERSITFSVSKQGEANSLEVIDAVKSLVNNYQGQVPDGIEFSWTNDNSVYIMRVIIQSAGEYNILCPSGKNQSIVS